MEVRRLTESEAQALWELRCMALELEPEAFAESLEEHLRMSVEEFASRIRSGSHESFVVGAWDESRLVGMAGFYREPRTKRRHRGWIWGMFVASGWRGSGVGRRLLEEVLSGAKNIDGIRCVLLSVASTQTTARRLYVSAGFQSIRTEPQALQVNGQLIDEEYMLMRI